MFDRRSEQRRRNLFGIHPPACTCVDCDRRRRGLPPLSSLPSQPTEEDWAAFANSFSGPTDATLPPGDAIPVDGNKGNIEPAAVSTQGSASAESIISYQRDDMEQEREQQLQAFRRQQEERQRDWEQRREQLRAEQEVNTRLIAAGQTDGAAALPGSNLATPASEPLPIQSWWADMSFRNACTGQGVRIRRSAYWIAIIALSAIHGFCYQLGSMMFFSERWIETLAFIALWVITAWFWVVAGVARGRDMGDPSYCLALLTLVPVLGWMPLWYLGAVRDEKAEYNPY